MQPFQESDDGNVGGIEISDKYRFRRLDGKNPTLILAGLLTCTALFAQDPACLDCHGEPELAREVGDGSIETLFVDPAGFRNSVHADMGCLGCHDGAGLETHPGLLPAEDCSTCHSDAQEELEAGSHRNGHTGDGIDDSNRAPGCTDCHGKHDVLAIANPGARTRRSEIPLLCGQCHGDQKFIREGNGILSTRPFFAYQESVHGQAIARGDLEAAVCTDCHGSHSLYPPSDNRSRISHSAIPNTCGRCHQEILLAYQKSLHGVRAARGDSEVPVCTDCHGIHSILPHVDPRSSVAEQAIARTTCPQCHAGERLSREFGVPAGKVESYLDSYHGLARQLGSVVVANCASCHGVHEILPSTDPRSSIYPENLPQTCGRCHPGAGENFTRGRIHLGTGEGQDSPGAYAVGIVRALYIPLILFTIGGMLLHNGVDFLRRMIRPPAPSVWGRPVVRWNRAQRWQHTVLVASFLCLAVTGFALKYPNAWWVDYLHLQEATRQFLHQAAAVLLVTLGVYHGLAALLTRSGRGELRALRPEIRDLWDAIHQIAFNLGLRNSPPRCGRYRYEEKLEYWALVWGSMIMVVTGAMLWFENISMWFLPKWALDAVTAVHLYEAWLATLAIIVWHLYFVIFRPGIYPMNWTWLTGKMEEGVYREEHPEEWDEKFRPADPPERRPR